MPWVPVLHGDWKVTRWSQSGEHMGGTSAVPIPMGRLQRSMGDPARPLSVSARAQRPEPDDAASQAADTSRYPGQARAVTSAPAALGHRFIPDAMDDTTDDLAERPRPRLRGRPGEPGSCGACCAKKGK